MPGIAPIQRSIFAMAFDGQEFVHEVDAGPAKGVRFFVRLPEDKGIWTGGYESSFATQVAKAIRPGMVAFDIGGWHGFFAGVMAANGAKAVHVFEPLPSNADRIAKLIELNPKFAIHLHAVAVAAEDGESQLSVMPDTSMAKLSKSTFQSDRAAIDHITVSTRRLDRLISEEPLEIPDIIKLDVEGAEVLVLEGASDMLRRHKPLIFAEIHSTALLGQCTTILEGYGYTVTFLDEDLKAAHKRDVFQIRATAA